MQPLRIISPAEVNFVRGGRIFSLVGYVPGRIKVLKSINKDTNLVCIKGIESDLSKAVEIS